MVPTHFVVAAAYHHEWNPSHAQLSVVYVGDSWTLALGAYKERVRSAREDVEGDDTVKLEVWRAGVPDEGMSKEWQRSSE